MFLGKNANNYYFLAKRVKGKDVYLEKVGLDPDSWLQTEILKATSAMNGQRADDLRKIQRRRQPILIPAPDNCHLRNKALQDITIADFPFGLPHVIITDPPYGKEFLDLYDTLAIKSAELLQPGGSLIVMTGQSYLPEVLNKLCRCLNYQWMVAYLTPGGQSAQLWAKRVNTFWKPVLWFVKGEYSSHWIGDVAKSAVNDNDKRFHKWGQSESGMADLIKRFSQRNDIIFDPFMGGGTTGIVALQLGRKFVGSDKDPKQVEITQDRIKNGR